MNYGAIKKFDIASGDGVRVSLFVSGCRNHCKGCFQSETWNFDYGREFDEAALQEILDALSKPFIQGLTILGGEPFEPENQPCVRALLERVKSEFPKKDIWCYTGYILETDLLAQDGARHTEHTEAILRMVDFLVDGPFILEQKDLGLKFRGSKNQRIINLREKELFNGRSYLSDA